MEKLNILFVLELVCADKYIDTGVDYNIHHYMDADGKLIATVTTKAVDEKELFVPSQVQRLNVRWPKARLYQTLKLNLKQADEPKRTS